MHEGSMFLLLSFLLWLLLWVTMTDDSCAIQRRPYDVASDVTEASTNRANSTALAVAETS